MTSYTQPNILIKYNEKRYLSHFVSEMFDSLILKSFFAMETYWVSDLPNIKAFLATFSVPFLYLKIVARMHDSAGIKIC